MKSKAYVGTVLALIIIVLAVVGCAWISSKINEKLSELNPDQPPAQSEQPINPPLNPPLDAVDASRIYLSLGNPSSASPNPANVNNFLIPNKFYALSYSREKAVANWVAWRLTQSDFGDAERQNDFRPSEELPDGWAKILPFDYSRSGFDRGHLCPSADRTASLEANSSTFLMTNIAPQTHSLNGGPWEKLESYSRSMARRNTTLYIFAGQYGSLGKIKNKVTIPSNFWKIIVVLPDNADISSIDYNTRIIAVDMPNIKGIDEVNWRDYRTTVQAIEQKTGYRFFTSLSPALQTVLKTTVDTR